MPLRMGFIAFANGSNYQRWKPTGEGREYELNETFEPMNALKDKFQIITNLAHDTANNWGDGPGDHARSGASFLTGCHAWKTLGSRLHLGISVDQIAARQVGHLTRLDSLQIGVEGTRLYGSCDTGYPCAYQYNISWASETLPLSPEPNPRAVFEKLFGAGTGAEREANLRQRLERRKSVLDFVMADVKRMNRELGRNDQQKVQEYLDGVRKMEQQIEKAERFKLPEPEIDSPRGIPASHEEHVDLMYDLMALAFQTDSTRVISYCVAPEGSNRPFPDLDIAEGHHFLTHHSGNKEKNSESRQNRTLVHGPLRPFHPHSRFHERRRRKIRPRKLHDRLRAARSATGTATTTTNCPSSSPAPAAALSMQVATSSSKTLPP